MRPTVKLTEKAYELSVRVAMNATGRERLMSELRLRVDPLRLGVGDEELDLPVRIVPERTTLRFEDDGLEIVLAKDPHRRERVRALRGFGL